VSADDWSERRGLLPSGPWREPLTALRRATHVVITRKAAGTDAVRAVTDALTQVGVAPSARAALVLDRLRALGGDESRPLESMAGARVLAVAAIATPGAFATQLRALGAEVTLVAFRDHHRFSTQDVASLIAQAGRHDVIVCTLKDAVKLAPIWPRAASSAWYVSQRVELEEGAEAMDALVRSLLAARASSRT
jgi:tetraacyldisaccharide 4'-kinase